MEREQTVERWRIKPGTEVDLAAIDPEATDGAPGGKGETKATFANLRGELREVQERLWAERRQSLLIVLQALDAGGKDGTIKHLFRGINPVGGGVVSFRTPTEEELAHDFLWRIHQHTPGKGEVVVFNRSHYEDVLVVRVHGLVSEEVWRGRYPLINQFEGNLQAAGTRILKLFLHISPDEQLRRFKSRIEDPTKRWKFRKGDLAERDKWGDYMAAYADAIEHTTTDTAPWFVIPSDHKWYRNWVVSQIVLHTLHQMNPAYPQGEDLEGVVL